MTTREAAAKKGMTARKARATSTAKAGQHWLEKSEGWCWVDFFGILHCVQDDGNEMRAKTRATATADPPFGFAQGRLFGMTTRRQQQEGNSKKATARKGMTARKGTTARKAHWRAGRGRGREADFSTALLTKCVSSSGRNDDTLFELRTEN
jgi:hypothetical protein